MLSRLPIRIRMLNEAQVDRSTAWKERFIKARPRCSPNGVQARGQARSGSTEATNADNQGALPTIYALATAAGTGAIAVFRLSGSRVRSVLGALLRVPEARLPPPRLLVPRTMYDPRRNYAFDRGMVVWFREPNSYTGEDMAELHVHGAPAVIQATLTALRGFPDVQPASAGAFTKRALVHGKMDVSQVEALGDLIQADSLNGLALAVTNLNGALRRQRDLWRAQLQEALAILEAVLEFGDEHLEQETEEQLSEATARIRAVQQEIRTQVRLASPDGRQPALTLTPRVVLYGRANAGKSSLFNVLGQREASIVHATPGTTRDVIEQRAFIDGLAVTLLDTAGLREAPSSDGGIEAEGIRRARSLVQQTSLRILVHDLSDPSKDAAEALTERGLEPSAVVLHKADLMRDVEARVEARRALQRRYPGASLFFVSSRTSEGVDSLLDWLGARLRNQVDATHQADGQRLLVQTQRQQALLGVVHDVLDDALRNISVPELAVEQVRLSLQYFAEMIGDGDRRFDAEEMLTRIFSRFCIGK